MATITEFEKLSIKERQNRYFSEDLKRKLVRDLDKNLTSVAEVGRVYQVNRSAIYKWIYKYSAMRKRGQKMVIESKSDTRKIEELKKKVAELERLIGQKQILLDFQTKMIELAEEEYRIDIKKKFSSARLSGSGNIGDNTTTK